MAAITRSMCNIPPVPYPKNPMAQIITKTTAIV